MAMITEYLTPVESVPPGKYAMWAPTEGESNFTHSEARKQIRRVYEALHGYQTYVFAAFLEDFKVQDEGGKRIGLPEELFTVYLTGPQDKPLIFSAELEKGMRFHFPAGISAPDRIKFWGLLADYVEAWKRVLEKNGAEKDPVEESVSLEWWLAVEDAVAATEETGTPVQVVGAIVV